MEQTAVRSASLCSVSLWCIFIYWTGYAYQVTAVDTGSIKEVPDQLVIFKAGHNVKDLGATGTDVDGTKVPQIGPVRLRKGMFRPEFRQGE